MEARKQKRITGPAFKRLRVKAGIGVSELARAWSVNRITIHEWEAGRKPIPYDKGALLLRLQRGG